MPYEDQPIRSPDQLHRAVRDVYRRCMAEHATQRTAFDFATELVHKHEPALDADEARRLVARMLANEPGPGDWALLLPGHVSKGPGGLTLDGPDH